MSIAATYSAEYLAWLRSDRSQPAPYPWRTERQRYSAVAVEKAIQASNRSGRRISLREAKAIHALLKGRE